MEFEQLDIEEKDLFTTGMKEYGPMANEGCVFKKCCKKYKKKGKKRCKSCPDR